MIRLLAVLGLLLAGRVAAAQSPVVRVDDAGPGVGPQVLVEALSHPYTVAPQGGEPYLIERASDNPRSIVVLGRDVLVEGRVSGDVIVVDGDLYMHPGGIIEGRALAFGGGVYESSLATISGGGRAFQDFTYDITPIEGGYSLRYRPLIEPPKPGWSFPGVFGIAPPEYDRSDGLAIGFSPRYSVPRTPLVLVPKVTYRSQLGAWDPSLAFEYNFSRRMQLTGRAERSTLSNDRWIRTDMLNSLDFLWSGTDVRNYYRAIYGEAQLSNLWETLHGQITPYVGVRVERASSVRPAGVVTGGPWTFLDREDEEHEDRLRSNPLIDEGTTYSALGGGTWRFSSSGFNLRLRLDGEAGTFEPRQEVVCDNGPCVVSVRTTFAQATAQGHLDFPTFSQQTLTMDGHFVSTVGERGPRQRYVYFGGPGTIPMLDLFVEGGDQLLYVDGRYVIPLHWFTLPFVGSPAFTLRELIGGAAVGRFPTIHQAVGGRLALKVLYAEWLIDPDTRRTQFGVGISLTP